MGKSTFPSPFANKEDQESQSFSTKMIAQESGDVPSNGLVPRLAYSTLHMDGGPAGWTL